MTQKKKFKLSNLYFYLLYVVIGIFILALAILATQIADIRMSDIKSKMANIQMVGQESRSLSVLIQYFLAAKRSTLTSEDMKNNEEEAIQKSFMLEATMESLFSDDTEDDKSKNQKVIKYNLLRNFSLSVLKFLDTTLFGADADAAQAFDNDPMINKGYLRERRKKFEEAISSYREFLSENGGINSKTDTYVYIHIIYCLSQLELYDEALNAINKLKTDFEADADLKNVIATMEDIILRQKEFKLEIAKGNNDYEKGTRSFSVGQYLEAKKYLELVGKENDRYNSAQFYLAWSNELIGNTGKAIDIYSNIIQNKDEKYSKYAANRLLILNKVYKVDQPALESILKSESVRNLNQNLNQNISSITDISKKGDVKISSEQFRTFSNNFSNQQSEIKKFVAENTKTVSQKYTPALQKTASIPAQSIQLSQPIPVQDNQATISNVALQNNVSTPVVAKEEPKVQTQQETQKPAETRPQAPQPQQAPQAVVQPVEPKVEKAPSTEFKLSDKQQRKMGENVKSFEEARTNPVGPLRSLTKSNPKAIEAPERYLYSSYPKNTETKSDSTPTENNSSSFGENVEQSTPEASSEAVSQPETPSEPETPTEPVQKPVATINSSPKVEEPPLNLELKDQFKKIESVDNDNNN